jgi:hypothetical protein
MKKRVMGGLGTVLLAIALAAFTGSALAGNGNGNTPPGQAKQAPSSGATSSNSSNGSTSQNSPAQPGTKPASNTAKTTSCNTGGGTGSSATCTPSNTATASAPSSQGQKDVSKRYGNGTTAAQIANSHGAPSNTPVKGPGNSQPHKVCAKNGHFVDVHAVKSYSSNCATTLSPSSSAKTPTTTTTTVSTTGQVSAAGQVAPAVVGGMAGASASVTSPAAGVLGSLATSKGHGVRGGVLGAVAAKRTGKLPFTGFSVWLGLLVGLALTGAGLGLRRYAREVV